VTYRPWLAEQALRQMSGLPAEALDILVRTMARICDDPYNRVFSMPLHDDSPSERMAEFGDFGFIEFVVDEAAALVRVYALVWAG
jgi:hypothetical protein